MKYFVIFSLIIFSSCQFAFADGYLRDVPEGHYAYGAVYDLINRGITGGFPDGTYRGKKSITRYEIASFLSKFAQSRSRAGGANEKLIEEMKNEVALLKSADDLKVAGNWQLRGRITGAETNADYRLRGKITKNFDDAASLKINLDTMDAGFNGGAARDPVRELLDFEGRVKIGRAELKITAGPGDVSHGTDILFPAESGMFFIRPRRAISAATTINKTAFSAEYLIRSASISGLIETSEVSVKITQNFPLLKLTVNPRYFTDPSGERDIRVDLSGELKPLGLAVLFGIAKNTDYPHGLFVRGDLNVGGFAKIIVQKVGSRYREKFSYNIFDLFDRNLANGATSYGIDLNKTFGNDWFVKAKGDYTNPGEALTTEYRVGKNFSASASLALTCQTCNNSNVFGISGDFKF